MHCCPAGLPPSWSRPVGAVAKPHISLIDISNAGPYWAASLTAQGAEERQVAAVLLGCLPPPLIVHCPHRCASGVHIAAATGGHKVTGHEISAVLQGCPPPGPEGKAQRNACEPQTCWAADAGGASCCTCQSAKGVERRSRSGQHTMAASPAPGRFCYCSLLELSH